MCYKIMIYFSFQYIWNKEYEYGGNEYDLSVLRKKPRNDARKGYH